MQYLPHGLKQKLFHAMFLWLSDVEERRKENERKSVNFLKH